MSSNGPVEDAFPPSPEDRVLMEENGTAQVAAGFPDGDAEKRAKHAARLRLLAEMDPEFAHRRRPHRNDEAA